MHAEDATRYSKGQNKMEDMWLDLMLVLNLEAAVGRQVALILLTSHCFPLLSPKLCLDPAVYTLLTGAELRYCTSLICRTAHIWVDRDLNIQQHLQQVILNIWISFRTGASREAKWLSPSSKSSSCQNAVKRQELWFANSKQHSSLFTNYVFFRFYLRLLQDS